MKTQSRILALLLVLGLALSGSMVTAQGGGIPTVPSFNGGAYGGPGMAGATGNVSGMFPQGLEGAVQAGPSAAGGALQGRGGRLTGALSGNLEGGISSFFGGDAEQIAAQISQIRGGDIPWTTYGGFGNGGETAAGLAAALSEGAAAWQGTLDEALGESLYTAFEAQIAALENASTEALDAAQAAYDQYWQDYYTMLDSLAQEYFGMTLADAEALYQEALSITVTALSEFEENAETYAEYCLYYPWDCYNYAYDAASGVYEELEAVSDAPVAEVVLGEVTSSETLWAIADEMLLNSPEAFEAIMVFANDQLGLQVQPLYAGRATQDIVNYLMVLPAPAATYASMMVDVESYWGLLNNGVAGVAIADCGADVVCNLDNMPQELSDASAGIYMIEIGAPMPRSSEEALHLVTTVFPAFNGLEFAEVVDSDILGRAFIATTHGVGATNDGQPLTVAKLIFTGVSDYDGTVPAAFAVVAIGEAQIQAFYDMFGLE